MDDTQQSRTSDAAATRKRRSSILKSQRAARAPLSELEFHVATPTDTAKSRRVSFSRRTGVAEFVTNEATTTWKNFYEEHNKSLESSGNESQANAPRPSSVGHIGKRIFEDQFQEVEIIDYGSTVNESRGVENSLNNVKFDQFALECTADDRKLTGPGPHFERTFTASEQPSKLFGDDLAISGFGEISDKINVDFSNLQPVGDDLDEIQKDIQRHQANQQNFLCPGPLNGRNMSGYIEVDLNTTHATVDCGANSLSEDMSITDTIHSPKVNVSKNSSSSLPDKCLNRDWVADKENIAVNPYVAPKESANFAINEVSDQVLVFDGKRLTLQSEREPITDYRKTLISTEQPNKPPQRKTIVINVDDDLPNFVANPRTSMSHHTKNCSANETLQDNNCDISMTQPLPARIETGSNKRQTIVFADISGDISMTQALPTNIAPEKHEKRRTIVFDNETADISVTQAVPANVIIPTKNVSVRESPVKKRQTIVFENETGDISMTQALPTNMILGEKQITEKRKTIVFDEDDGNISVTKAIPSNILLSNTPIDDSAAMLSILPPKLVTNKRKTIVFNDEDGNISVTTAIPSQILLAEEPKYIRKSPFEDVDVKLSITNSEMESNKRNTIVFNDDDGNISVTKAIPATVFFKEEVKPLQNAPSAETHKRKTLVFDDEDGNISVTKTIPSNIIISEEVKPSQNAPLVEKHKRKTIVFDDEDGNISVTKAIPSNIIISEETRHFQNSILEETHAISSSSFKQEPSKRKTIVFNDEDGNISVTKAIPSNILLLAESKSFKSTFIEETDVIPSSLSSHRKPGHEESIQEHGYISMTNALSSNLTLHGKETSENVTLNHEVPNESMIEDLHSKIILEKNNFELLDEMQYSSNQSRRMSSRPKINIAYEDDMDISMTQMEPSNIVSSEKTKTKVYNEDLETISVLETVSMADIVVKTRHSTVCNTDSVKMTDKTFITENNAEQTDSTTKSCHETSPTHAGLSKSMVGCKLESNKSIKIESDSKIISVIQMDTSNVGVNTSTTTESNNAGDMSVVPECIILREFDSALNPIKSPTGVMQENSGNLDNIDPTNTAHTKEDQVDMSIINLEDTLNRSQIKEDKNVLEIVNASNLNVCVPDLKNVTGIKEELNNVNINIFRTDTQSVMVCQVADQTLIKDISYRKHDHLERGDAFSAITSEYGKEKSIMISSQNDHVIIDESVAVTVSSRISIPAAIVSAHITDKHLELKSNKDSNTTVDDVIIPIYNSSTNIEDVKITNTNVQIATKSKSNTTVTSTSDDNLFYITKDCDCGSQTEDNEAENYVLKIKDDLELDLNKSKNYGLKEKIYSNSGKIINVGTNINQEVNRKSYKDADCTKDLLDMLSKYTEQEEEEPPVKDTRTVASENKTELAPERLLSHPRRQSVVLSREDLMNNISMAQAMLQSSVASLVGRSQPELELDSSGAADTPPSAHKPPADPLTSSRLSSEVVKTLHFEDDDSSIDPKENTATTLTTSLIKTALNKRSSLIEESKEGLVIPANMKDVSGKIKALMSDFVNPQKGNQTLMPCNRQVQVNLDVISNETEKTIEGNRTHNYTDQTSLGAIPFDLYNPLNNVLLIATKIKDSSKYEPNEDTLKPTDHSADEESIRNHSIKRSLKDVKSENNLMHIKNSATSKKTSHLSSRVLKDAESGDNMMQVDAGMAENDSRETSPNVASTCSQFKMDVSCSEPQEPPPTVEPSLVSIGDIQCSEIKSKYEKRKHKTCSRSPQEVTPKPASKIPKRSVSPVDEVSADTRTQQGLKEEIKSPPENAKSPEMMTPLKHNSIVSVVLQEAARDLRTDHSPASGAAESSEHSFSESSGGNNIEDDLNNEMELETQSSVPLSPRAEPDALAAIDRLSCIQNGEVEWERRSDDEWSFLLLYKRVRLIVRLARTHAARRGVRASAPVTDVTVEHAQPVEIAYKKNASSALCVRFALESMRRVLAGGVGGAGGAGAGGPSTAGEAAGALARCAALARLAARWARAMQLSWAHLAYSLTEHGRLNLCVANIPLRSVWEVSMTIELAHDANVPYPAARSVLVTPLMTCTDVTPADVARCVRGVGADWGHAPRTLWKIFKYLKNKPLEEQLLGGLVAHKH